MSHSRCRHLSFLILAGLMASPLMARATDTARKTPDPNQPGISSNAIYPQVVRISYLDGDVRVSRGKASEKASQSDWEVAVAGLPIETGFNLATGNGRAEIEFEDASTVYLAENSVLAFNDLHTGGGIPYTTIALLTGTATMYVTNSWSSSFTLITPTGRLIVGDRANTYLRVTSFPDGIAVSARAHSLLRLPDSPSPVEEPADSATLYYAGTTRVAGPQDAQPATLIAWDQWVDERVNQRTRTMAAVMKQAGLDTPLPGLVDLAGKGSFFSCEPYGTCWAPTAVADADRQTASGADPPQRGGGPSMPSLDPNGQAATPWLPLYDSDPFQLFPCAPDRISLMYGYDARSGGYRNTNADPFGMDYDWTRCHTGSWIHYRGHYTWVVGHRVHHHCPVTWVKAGHTTGFVPIHPRDVSGKPPLNLQHGIFTVKDGGVRLVTYDPRVEPRILRGAPREFEKPVVHALAPAAAPRIELHSVRGIVATPVVAGERAEPLHATLVFDRRSQSFLLSRQMVTPRGGVRSIAQPFEGHGGNLQAHVGGVDAHGNYSMRAGGGGSGGFRGGSGSSASAHSSGGGSVGGGGHSGGGASGGSSMSSGSSSSAGASSGGSHH